MASIAGIGSMMDLESFSQEPKSDGTSYATFSLRCRDSIASRRPGSMSVEDDENIRF